MTKDKQPEITLPKVRISRCGDRWLIRGYDPDITIWQTARVLLEAEARQVIEALENYRDFCVCTSDDEDHALKALEIFTGRKG